MGGLVAVLAASGVVVAAVSDGLDPVVVLVVGVVVLVVAVVVAALAGRRSGRQAISQRLTALGSRLGIDAPEDSTNIEVALSYLEQVTGAATEAVADSSADAIRLRRSLDALPEGVVLCDESGAVVYRNARADLLMSSRHGDALAAQAVTELLEDAWDHGTAERTLDLYGPPRRTLSVRASLIDDGRRPLGVIATIEDISEKRRLEEIRRDFVANVSHELKTPMGALGLLAETLVAEPDTEVGRRLASRIHTEAFRVSRIIDDLLDLSRIESEEAPPREPVLVNLVMAEAVERVRSTAEQRGITITLSEPDPPVAVLGDRRQLVSAMHALIENAVTYSYGGSDVAVQGTHVKATAGALGTAVQSARAEAALDVGAVAGGASGPGESAPRATSEAGYAPATQPGGIATSWRDPLTPPKGSPIGSNGQPQAHASQPAADPAGAYTGPQAMPGAGNGAGTGRPAVSTPPAPLTGAAPPTPGTAGGGNGTFRAETAQPTISHDTVRISVVDHGIGIPARDLERIFERFYRVDHGRSRDTGGTGLGLSIVRHVASNHQGWVEVESREGEGSTFTLVLPA